MRSPLKRLKLIWYLFRRKDALDFSDWKNHVLGVPAVGEGGRSSDVLFQKVNNGRLGDGAPCDYVVHSDIPEGTFREIDGIGIMKKTFK